MNNSRRAFLKNIGTGAIGLGLLPLARGCSILKNKPNIVFIYADDLDFDQMNVDCYPPEVFPCFTGAHRAGKSPDYYVPEDWDPYYFEPNSIYTPNMNKLSKQGAHFTRFYITSAMCTPSRYSSLTGKYAHKSPSLRDNYKTSTTAPIEWEQYMSDRDNNLAKKLKKAGYFTAITGKWHNGEPKGVGTRDVYNKYKHDPKLMNQKMKEAQKRGCRFLENEIGFDLAQNISFGNADRCGGHNLPWNTEAALDILDRAHKKPFFLYFPLPVPHGVGGGGEFKKDLKMSAVGKLDKIPDSQPPISDVYRRIRENGYSDRSVMFTWIDDCLGEIMNKLKEKGVAENTILIFASDHQSRGKFSCYEGARVPCFIRWPKNIPRNLKIDDVCANIDLLPTLLEIAGQPIPDDIDGQSILPKITNQSDGDDNRAILLETGYTKAVVKGNYKYIANRPPQKILNRMQKEAQKVDNDLKRQIGWDGEKNKNAGNWGVRFSNNQYFRHYFAADQLYNLKEDVFEQNNIAEERPEKVKEMQHELRKLLNDCPYEFGEFTKSREI